MVGEGGFVVLASWPEVRDKKRLWGEFDAAERHQAIASADRAIAAGAKAAGVYRVVHEEVYITAPKRRD